MVKPNGGGPACLPHAWEASHWESQWELSRPSGSFARLRPYPPTPLPTNTHARTPMHTHTHARMSP